MRFSFTGGRRRLLAAGTVLALAAVGSGGCGGGGAGTTTVTVTRTVTASAATTTQAPPPPVHVHLKPLARRGRKLFVSNTCVDCHTLADAHATGRGGPNLDQIRPSEAAVVGQVTGGSAEMPAFRRSLTPAQIRAIAAYVS